MSVGLVWFRSDLRLGDNPAWAAATSGHERVVALFVLDPVLWDGSGAASPQPAGGPPAGARWGAAVPGRAAAGPARRPAASWCRPKPDALGAERVFWNGDVTPYAARRRRGGRPGGWRAGWRSTPGASSTPPAGCSPATAAPSGCSPPSTGSGRRRPGRPGPEPGEARVDGRPRRRAPRGRRRRSWSRGRRRRRPASRPSWRGRTATARSGTVPTWTPPPASPPTSSSARSARERWPAGRRGRGRAGRPSCASSPGGSSTPSSWPPSRRPGAGRCGPSTTGWPGATTPRAWPPGPRGAPATPSSMRPCASCGPRAGSTTGRGWWPPPSWSRTC